MHISCLPDITKPGELVTCNAITCLRAVQSGRWADRVLKVRNIYQREGKSKAYGRAKLKLPGFIFAGIFSYAKNDALDTASGLISIDIDEDTLPTEKLAESLCKLREDVYTMAAFISPSGVGIKTVMRIPIVKDDAEFKCYFSAIKGYLRSKHGLVCDEACKDIRRACYVSFDPELYLNLDAKVFTEKYKAPKMYRPTAQKIPQHKGGWHDPRLPMRAYRMLETAPDHTKNITRIKAGRLIGGMIAGGQLPDYIADELKDAAASFSQNPKQARIDIEKGIAYGMAFPLTRVHTERYRIERQLKRKANRKQL